MIGSSTFRRSRGKTEGEKPFWISYADLMTAMMTLFLAAMAVTMVAITREVKKEKDREADRRKDIQTICTQLRSALGPGSLVKVDCENDRNRISFGEAGLFAHNDFHLPTEAGKSLAELVPAVLHAADSAEGKKWFKQVVIEGFTDTDGSYLYNLHLSLQRSEWVMCMLLDPKKNTDLQLNPDQLQRVRDLFLAGGVSFNNAKGSKDESRRVELRLQFYGLAESESGVAGRPVFRSPTVDTCQLL